MALPWTESDIEGGIRFLRHFLLESSEGLYILIENTKDGTCILMEINKHPLTNRWVLRSGLVPCEEFRKYAKEELTLSQTLKKIAEFIEWIEESIKEVEQ